MEVSFDGDISLLCTGELHSPNAHLLAFPSSFPSCFPVMIIITMWRTELTHNLKEIAYIGRGLAMSTPPSGKETQIKGLEVASRDFCHLDRYPGFSNLIQVHTSTGTYTRGQCNGLPPARGAEAPPIAFSALSCHIEIVTKRREGVHRSARR
jgi:hypothetical protein